MEHVPLMLADYIEILKRRKWSFIVPTVVIIVFTTAIALILPPIYKATSKILIEEQDIPADFVTATVSSYAAQRLESINQRIMSSTRLAEIIQQFRLYEDLRDKWTIDEITKKMREDIELELISADVLDKRTGRSKNATIAFTLSFRGKRPSVVQQVTGTLASLFLEENIKIRERQVQETAEFLEDELEKIQTELDRVETRIAVFKQENISQLPDLLQANIQALDRQENSIAAFEEQLRSLSERRAYLQTELVGMATHLDKELVKEGTKIPTDREKLELLKLEYNLLQSRYKDQHPDVIKIRDEIKRLETQLVNKLGPKIANNKTDDKKMKNPQYVILELELESNIRETAYVKRLIESHREKANEYRRRIETTPMIEGTYRAMSRQRENLQVKANDLLKKLMESRVAQGLEKAHKGERFTIIDPARRPSKPYEPNRLAIVLVGIVLGIGAGGSLVVLREVADSSVWDARQLSRITSLPVLGSIPEMETIADIKNRKVKRYTAAVAAAGIILVGVLFFHLLVMDIKEFIAIIIRRMVS